MVTKSTRSSTTREIVIANINLARRSAVKGVMSRPGALGDYPQPCASPSRRLPSGPATGALGGLEGHEQDFIPIVVPTGVSGSQVGLDLTNQVVLVLAPEAVTTRACQLRLHSTTVTVRKPLPGSSG